MRISNVLVIVGATVGATATMLILGLNRPRIAKTSIPPIEATDLTSISTLDRIILDHRSIVIGRPELAVALAAEGRPFRLVGALWVDRCEVTQGEFQKFAFDVNISGNHDRCAKQEGKGFRHFSAAANHPLLGANNVAVSGITFHDAYAYCRWKGGRLPTVEEHEAIAAGTERRLYPWGNEFDRRPWLDVSPHVPWTSICGEFPTTDSPDGIHDLGNGVAEWTMGDWPEGRPTRSGADAHALGEEVYALNMVHITTAAMERSPTIGVRCVYDRDPKDGDVVRIEPGTFSLGPSPTARLPRLIRAAGVGPLRNASELLLRSRTEASDFAIREITRRDYAAFLGDPFVRLGLYSNVDMPNGHSHVPDRWEAQLREPELPVSGVDWWDAWAFASWAGGRLPNAEEWSNAASNQGRTVYPWGEAYEVDHSIGAEVGRARAFDPGRTDRTTNGIYDLAGNLSEWTSTITMTQHGNLSYPASVVRGGNFRISGRQYELATQFWIVPLNHRDDAIGIRVVWTKGADDETFFFAR